MRVMVLVKGNKDSEAGVLPDHARSVLFFALHCASLPGRDSTELLAEAGELLERARERPWLRQRVERTLERQPCTPPELHRGQGQLSNLLRCSLAHELASWARVFCHSQEVNARTRILGTATKLLPRGDRGNQAGRARRG